MYNILSKESVGKVVLTVSSATTILMGGMLYNSNAELNHNVKQLGETQLVIERNQSDYKKLEQEFLSVVSDSEKLKTEQEGLKAQIEAFSKEKESMQGEYKYLQDRLKETQDELALQKKRNEVAKDSVNNNVSRGSTKHVDNKYLIAQLVNAEAKGESFDGKVAVAEVILNRMNSNEFPDTAKGVIYQTNQFSPITDGSINNTPSQDAINAVEVALGNTDITKGALFFYNDKIVTQSWLQSRATTVRIGNHLFKK